MVLPSHAGAKSPRENIMALKAKILSHFEIARTITIRDAVINYGISGGTFTKIISELRRDQHRIIRTWKKAPTGTRYACYTLVEKWADWPQDDVQGKLAV